MLDTENKRWKEQQKQKVKKRYNVTIDPENYLFIPAKKQTDYYDNDVNQRVAIYVRVSTDDVRQTTSYELQKKYYEEFVTRHPNWTLVKIYADEGISGTSLKHRDEFNKCSSHISSTTKAETQSMPCPRERKTVLPLHPSRTCRPLILMRTSMFLRLPFPHGQAPLTGCEIRRICPSSHLMRGMA